MAPDMESAQACQTPATMRRIRSQFLPLPSTSTMPAGQAHAYEPIWFVHTPLPHAAGVESHSLRS